MEKGGVKNDSKKLDIIYGRPLKCFQIQLEFSYQVSYIADHGMDLINSMFLASYCRFIVRY